MGSTSEISELTEIPLVRVRRLLAVPEEPLSLEMDEGQNEVAAMAAPEPDQEEKLASSELVTMVRHHLRYLTPREERVIRMRFAFGFDGEQTLEEIGQQIGLTRERIRQIEAKALKKLSHPGRIKSLQGLL
jgi:RNA polymerase primary sigma factor